ncbi:MAG: type restriction enzyme subunit [Chloroflexota bacterium]|nr:type restriction enzyme subunit [Chloroflexota bacterium]
MTYAVEDVSIGSLASDEKGAFKIGPFGSSLRRSELVSAGIPVVGIENVRTNEFVKGGLRYITPEKFQELSDYAIHSGDVLVTTMGTIGRSAVAPPDVGQAIIDSHLFRMRLDTRRVLPAYVCYALNSQLVARQLERLAHGAIMDGLNTSILNECIIPLPTISEQGRIVTLLDRADRLRKVRLYAVSMSTALLQELFVQMFLRPEPYAGEWTVRPLGDLGTLDRGRSRHRPRNAPHLYGGPYPFIQTGDVAKADRFIYSHTQTYSMEGLSQSKLWPAGTLCITIAANIAATAILTYPACFPDSVVGFVPGGRVTTEFIEFWLGSQQRSIEQTAREVAQKNINLEILRDLPCPVPPLELQQYFSSFVKLHVRLAALQREGSRLAEHLYGALLEECFDRSAGHRQRRLAPRDSPNSAAPDSPARAGLLS